SRVPQSSTRETPAPALSRSYSKAKVREPTSFGAAVGVCRVADKSIGVTSRGVGVVSGTRLLERGGSVGGSPSQPSVFVPFGFVLRVSSLDRASLRRASAARLNDG